MGHLYRSDAAADGIWAHNRVHCVNIEQHATMSMIFALFAVAIYVFALLDKRYSALDGQITWSRGFVSGISITLLVVVPCPFTQLITHYITTPDFFAKIADHAVESGYMKREDAESYFSLRNDLIHSAFGEPGLGVVRSSLVAIFTRQKNRA